MRNQGREGLRRKIEIDLQCTRCQRRIRWAWVITYNSFRYSQLVYVCSECGNLIKVANTAEEVASSIGLRTEDVAVSSGVPP